MKLFVEVQLVMSVLALVLTLVTLGKKASITNAISALMLSGWITWAAVLLLGAAH